MKEKEKLRLESQTSKWRSALIFLYPRQSSSQSSAAGFWFSGWPRYSVLLLKTSCVDVSVWYLFAYLLSVATPTHNDDDRKKNVTSISHQRASKPMPASPREVFLSTFIYPLVAIVVYVFVVEEGPFFLSLRGDATFSLSPFSKKFPSVMTTWRRISGLAFASTVPNYNKLFSVPPLFLSFFLSSLPDDIVSRKKEEKRELLWLFFPSWKDVNVHRIPTLKKQMLSRRKNTYNMRETALIIV